MSGSSAAPESGFTLIEIVIAVAIVATTVAAGFGISLASRSLAVSTAAGEFDQFLDSARTMARDLDGTTLAFTTDAYGDGTEVRLFAGGPNDPPASTTLPTLHARATIEESESLGKTPFAFIVHANGSLSGRPNYRIGETTTNDVGCPASGAFHFVIKAAGGSADRFVPCRIKLAANGPVTLMAWPLAASAPSPTPCSSGPGCSATSLPSAPTSTASCPPNYTGIPGGCVPAPSTTSGARYHVTITGAPTTLAVGATGSFTAQATLTNPNAVLVGTPASLPVGVQAADTTCTTAPSGSQPSGATFTIAGAAPGSCTITAQANTSSVPGAVSDMVTVVVTIIPGSGGEPSPPPQTSCDLLANGKCYRRIVDSTTQLFNKTVSPQTSCDPAQPDAPCIYLDSIRSITLDEYSLSPRSAPVDVADELLFRINRIDGVLYGCIPYSSFFSVPANDPLPLTSTAVGGPTDLPLGFGNPFLNTAVNNVFVGEIPTAFNEKSLSSRVRPTLSDMTETMLQMLPGLPYAFTFHASDASSNARIVWLPDFPGCDNAGDPMTPGTMYGTVGVKLTFEVFQAVP